jgi:hypothetical protein
MNDSLRNQTYRNLNNRETDELLDIWQKNDRVEWTDTAFDVMKDILMERLGEVPAQGEPIFEYAGGEDDESYGFSEFELKIIDDENPPEFYDPFDVLRISKYLDTVAIVAVIVSLLSFIPAFWQFKDTFDSLFQNILFLDFLPFVLSFGLTVFETVLQIIILYFPLRALSHVLRVLMQMEFNSRLSMPSDYW